MTNNMRHSRKFFRMDRTIVPVEASDDYGNSFVFLVDPGTAPASAIGELFVAMSDLHRACGGDGLTFRVIHGAAATFTAQDRH